MDPNSLFVIKNNLKVKLLLVIKKIIEKNKFFLYVFLATYNIEKKTTLKTSKSTLKPGKTMRP